MNLIKTSALSFIATMVKLVAGLVVNKVAAIYIGPSGFAAIGQFQNFIQMVSIAAQGGINQGVVKLIAEHRQNRESLVQIFSTGLKISLVASVFISTMLVLFPKSISYRLTGTYNYSYIIVLFGCTIYLFVANNYLLSILNGLKEIEKYITINIIQSVCGLIFTAFLIYFWKIDGALIALVTNQSIVFFIIIAMLRKHKLFGYFRLKRAIDQRLARSLLGFSAMALVSCICIPLSHMVIRNYIGTHIGWDAAGYWQAIWYISAAYMMVITTTLSTYYLPRLSEVKERSKIRAEIYKSALFLLPIAILLSLSIYFLRDIIIQVLFTEKFESIKDLFLYQLLGDVVKITSWALGFLTIAKGMTRTFIAFEILGSISFVLLSILFVDAYGLIGVTMAYLANYLLYLLVLIYIFRDVLFYDGTSLLKR